MTKISGLTVPLVPREHEEAVKLLKALGYRWDGYKWVKPMEVG
jgi:hypothetical protein